MMNHEKVQEIKILNRKDTSRSVVISDPILIKELLGNCLNGARREPLKFEVHYQLLVKEIDTSYLIYVNGRSINRGGVT